MATKTVVNINIDNKHYQVHVEDMTGAALKHLAGIQDINLLFREVHGPGDDEQIQNDTVVHLHNGDHFYDMPPGNFGAA
jgi:Multiubiquitin